MLVRLALLFIALCVAAQPYPVAAQETIPFIRTSVEDGLSQGSVQAVAQDLDGFIWIGTQHGLNRYDGYDFLSYFHDPSNPASLSSDWIWALHLGASGDLWVGTKGGGLDRVDPGTGRVQRYLLSEEVVGGGAFDVRAIVGDSEGHLWIGSDGGGVIRFDPETGRSKHFRVESGAEGSISNNRVKALHVDAAGQVWVGTDGGGLNRIDPVTERVTSLPFAGMAEERVRSIFSDGQGLLWVGTYDNGVMLLDPNKGVTRRFGAGETASSLSSNSVRALMLDQNRQLWVGTQSQGLNRIDPATASVSQLRHMPADVRSLSNDHVTALFQDRGGVIWVGTHNGVNSWNPQTGHFSTHRRGPGEGEGLSGNMALAFAEHPDGRLLVGTTSGVDAVDLESGAVERLDRADGASTLSDERVMAMVPDGAGGLWVGTRAGGLNHFDLQTGAARAYRHVADDPGSLGADGVTSLHRDPDGTLWVGTYRGGLNRLAAGASGFTRFRQEPGDARSLCSDRVLAIFRDRAQRLWIGTHGGGLCLLDEETGEFSRFLHDASNPDSLSSNEPWALTEDPAGNLWIGTSDAGLNLWRAKDREAGRAVFRRIGPREGLPSPTVYGVLSDSRGWIWAASNRGLTRIRTDGDRLQMRTYTGVDGLQGNEFNFGAAFRASTGQLFFGGTQGFSGFFPQQVGINRNPPRLAFTGFQLNYEDVGLATLLDEDGQLPLRHTHQHVTFEYSALDYTDPKGNSYEYRLDGFDGGWVADRERRGATYTNLPAGDYTLRVRGQNGDGVWSSEELTLPITVLPAPWATWYAQASYVLVVLLLLSLAYRMQAAKLARAAEMNRVQASLISEITARQIKEAELAQTRNRAQRYLDVVEVIILALDKRGNVMLVNQKGVRILGYDEAEIVGRNFYECFVPEAQRDAVRTKFQNLDRYAYSESPIKPKEGDERMIAWHAIAAPPLDDDDEAGGVLISGADVTQMRNLERQLRDAQKMDALGTLARGVAHDFNNILTSILGYVQLAQLAEPKAVVADNLGKLESSVLRARDLVARILTFGRASGQPSRVVPVEEAAREALELVAPLLGANVRVQTSFTGTNGAVLADPTQLVQVVLNLCTNAAQAMGEDGGILRVEVSDYEVGVEEARNRAVLVPGEHVRLSVSDTGPGMDDYTLTRIFDPFFTTRHREEGTGLGLSLVHSIVTQLRGAVQVFSSPGEGTRFEVLLPRTRRQPGEEPPAQEPMESLEGSETLLFVDDEPSVRAIGKEALTKLGYRVLLAADAPEALAIFERRAHEIDAVVTDQTMPSQLGHKLAEAFKAIRPEVPVLLMSGAGRPESDCVDGFVEKPFSLNALASALRALLAEKPSADRSRS